jgi:Na+-driven multidrug efflux pump
MRWGLDGLWIGLTVALVLIASLLVRRWQTARIPALQ